MPRLSRGIVLQDFARDGEDLLDTLLATASRPADLHDHAARRRNAHFSPAGTPYAAMYFGEVT